LTGTFHVKSSIVDGLVFHVKASYPPLLLNCYTT
jgi:hypothetical protein